MIPCLKSQVCLTSLVAPAIMDPKTIVTHIYQLGVSLAPVVSLNRSKVDGLLAA